MRPYRPWTAVGLIAVVVVTVASACSSDDDDAAAPDNVTAMSLSTPDFFDGSAIPATFTCDGEGESPSLEWTGAPAETAEFRLTVVDPDAPSGGFLHWQVDGIGLRTAGVGIGAVPPGVEADNDAGTTGWTPPCPPRGDGPHRYVFTIEALDADGAVVARGSMFGTFERAAS